MHRKINEIKLPLEQITIGAENWIVYNSIDQKAHGTCVIDQRKASSNLILLEPCLVHEDRFPGFLAI